MGHESRREWDSESERQRKAEYRERKRLEAEDRGKPWAGLVGEEREQAIRDFYGYSASETRSKAERDAAAARMVANSPFKDIPSPGFPARPGDLAPTPAQLRKLGGLWPGR